MKTKKKKRGPPTKKTPDRVNLLRQAFALDASVEEAVFYANISKQTYYDWVNSDKELSDELEALRNKPVLRARQIVIKGMEDNPELALKYLERKRKSEFSQKQIIENEGSIAIHSVDDEIKTLIENLNKNDFSSRRAHRKNHKKSASSS